MTLSKFLSIAPVEPAHFDRNFIRQVVCELRFPTNFDLDGVRPPVDFAKALRKDYPNYEARNEVNLGGLGSVAKANVHAFSSKGRRWTVTIRASAVTLESTHYASYEDFQSRISAVVHAARKVIDSPFFTRIGLRYINVVPLNGEDIKDWINPVLVGPLGDGVYGMVQEYSQRVAGSVEGGGNYLFQHGIGMPEGGEGPGYALDFDFSEDDVDVDDAVSVAEKLHKHQFAMFMWSLGEKAKTYLSESTKTNRS